MNNDRLREIVEDGVNDLILVYQEEVGIEDGGIDLFQTLEINRIEEELANWIRRAFPWE